MGSSEPFVDRLNALKMDAPEELARLERERDELDERIEFLRKLSGSGRARRESKPSPTPELVRELVVAVRLENGSLSDEAVEAETKRRLKKDGYRVIGIHRSIRSILAEPDTGSAEG